MQDPSNCHWVCEYCFVMYFTFKYMKTRKQKMVFLNKGKIANSISVYWGPLMQAPGHAWIILCLSSFEGHGFGWAHISKWGFSSLEETNNQLCSSLLGSSSQQVPVLSFFCQNALDVRRNNCEEFTSTKSETSHACHLLQIIPLMWKRSHDPLVYSRSVRELITS